MGVILPIFSMDGNVPSAIAELKCAVKTGVRMLESFSITRIGKSLDLQNQ